MKNQVSEVRDQFLNEIQSANDANSLEALRVKYLGRKGSVTGLFKLMGKVSADERPAFGKLLNELRDEVETALKEKTEQADSTPKRASIDLSLPGRKPRVGRLHPLTQIAREIKQIFGRMGFSIADPTDVNFDPEPDDLLPAAIDWDEYDLERNSPLIHQPHRSLRSVA